jgi:hypothetical protein
VMDGLLRSLRQPEYLHVLLNPLPVYGLAVSWIGLLVALILRSRSAQLATLTIVMLSAASAWPVYELGQDAYDVVYSFSDEPGDAWLAEHKERAEHLIYFFYALALLSAAAIALPAKWPKSALPLALAVLIGGAFVLGMGGYIAYAGGKVRHREFRSGPLPPKKSTTAFGRDDHRAAALGSTGRWPVVRGSLPRTLPGPFKECDSRMPASVPGKLPGTAGWQPALPELCLNRA